MKKVLALFLASLLVFSISACEKTQTTFDIKIVIPAGSTENFVYSHTEVSPLKDKITIYSGEGLGDTEVVLKTIQAAETTAYEPTYITHGMPVVMYAEQGGWFKIGINMQNHTEEDITVFLTVKDVEVRI